MRGEKEILEQIGKEESEKGRRRIEGQAVAYGGRMGVEILELTEEGREGLENLVNFYTAYQLRREEQNPELLSERAEVAKKLLAAQVERGLEPYEQAEVYVLVRDILTQLEDEDSELSRRMQLWSNGERNDEGDRVYQAALRVEREILANLAGHNLEHEFPVVGRFGFGGFADTARRLFPFTGPSTIELRERSLVHQRIEDKRDSMNSGEIFESFRQKFLDELAEYAEEEGKGFSRNSAERQLRNIIEGAETTQARGGEEVSALQNLQTGLEKFEVKSRPGVEELAEKFLADLETEMGTAESRVLEDMLAEDIDRRIADVLVSREIRKSPKELKETLEKIDKRIEELEAESNSSAGQNRELAELKGRRSYVQEALGIVIGDTADRMLETKDDQKTVERAEGLLGRVPGDNLRDRLREKLWERGIVGRGNALKRDSTINKYLKELSVFDFIMMLMGIVKENVKENP